MNPLHKLAAPAIALTLAAALCACNAPGGGTAGIDFAHPSYDKDFSGLANPGFQEGEYRYQYFFLPGQDSGYQEYVGDPMPYYEDGTFYIYYLKDGGDSFHHSIYLATTSDFTSYTEHPDPIIEATSGAQDDWVGTGSVVKVKDKYYFFYTGHAGSAGFEYAEKIMVAEGTSPTSFTKRADWSLTPPKELGQKTDFRDPQAYFDAERGVIELTVTAAQGGVAQIQKFTLSEDLKESTYDGSILRDPTEAFWNLECSDTFKLGDRYYLTYSGQDDTLWYASSKTAYGPYDKPQRLDDKLFYAAKHVEDGEKCYMVGWLRRSETPMSVDEVSAWGGNLVVQEVGQNDDGSLYLKPVETVTSAFADRRELRFADTSLTVKGGKDPVYKEAFTAYERFLITGEFTYDGTGTFGLAFDLDGTPESYKLISASPSDQTISLAFGGGKTPITSTAAALDAGKPYRFTYLQEGSCGVLWVDGLASLSVRLYGVSGKPVYLFAQNGEARFTNLCEYTAPPK